MHKDRLNRLSSHFDAYISEGQLPCLSCVIEHRGQTVFNYQAGYSDIEAQAPINHATLFRIYSLSKPIISVAVMRLFEQGHLLLTDPISKYLPELDNLQVYESGSGSDMRLSKVKRDIEVADLLCHTAGFGYGHEVHPVDELYRHSELFQYDQTIDEMVAKLASLPLKFQPGQDWEYSVAHDVLGCLIERVSGVTLDIYLKEEIFGPLGMNSTAFSVPKDQQHRLTKVYKQGENGSLEEDHSTHSTQSTKVHGFFAGGEGLVSTVSDCTNFMRMLANQGRADKLQFLSRKSVDLMTRNHLSERQRQKLWIPGHGFGFGLGVLVDPAAYRNLGSSGEFGWAGSGSTYFWADPSEQLVSVLFSQFLPSSQYTLPREFKTLMYQALV